ncbi:MAG TPA: hypothetical protein VF753_14275 [Terriglobales bacterium]
MLGFACAIGLIGVSATLVIRRAEPILRQRVIQTLAARFKSKVELDAFHVSAYPVIRVSGSGLRIFGDSDPNSHEPGVQPIIAVQEFSFSSGLMSLFRSPMHINTVHLKGLQLNLPPKQRWAEMKRITPKDAKISIIVDKFVSDTAELVINTDRPEKLPLEFSIERLQMTRIGSGQPLRFEADLINPKPVGDIHSSGNFGPWAADDPRDTPVSGTYSFRNADLSTIKGIGGILSSTGNYEGTLSDIVVDGTTDTPDFRIAVSGRPVPLHTDFHAIVDGTSGDTYLRPVKAKLLNTWMVATGSVVRMQQPHGHHVLLDVAIEKGKIDDLLRLAVKTDPPIMTGEVQLKTKLDLPPGQEDVANRMKLAGTFQVTDAHFNNPKIQDKVDQLSVRARGLLKQARAGNIEDVNSKLGGKFSLESGVLSFSTLQYAVPGAEVDLAGRYSLDGNQFVFHGKAYLDAKLSQMVTGWKSAMLKPVDPFFRKHGDTEVPVKIAGTRSELHFGPDFHHHNPDLGHQEQDQSPAEQR